MIACVAGIHLNHIDITNKLAKQRTLNFKWNISTSLYPIGLQVQQAKNRK